MVGREPIPSQLLDRTARLGTVGFELVHEARAVPGAALAQFMVHPASHAQELQSLVAVQEMVHSSCCLHRWATAGPCRVRNLPGNLSDVCIAMGHQAVEQGSCDTAGDGRVSLIQLGPRCSDNSCSQLAEDPLRGEVASSGTPCTARACMGGEGGPKPGGHGDAEGAVLSAQWVPRGPQMLVDQFRSRAFGEETREGDRLRVQSLQRAVQPVGDLMQYRPQGLSVAVGSAQTLLLVQLANLEASAGTDSRIEWWDCVVAGGKVGDRVRVHGHNHPLEGAHYPRSQARHGYQD